MESKFFLKAIAEIDKRTSLAESFALGWGLSLDIAQFNHDFVRDLATMIRDEEIDMNGETLD